MVMETWNAIGQLVKKRDCAFSSDLEKEYVQVGLGDRMRHFCVL